MSKFRQVAFRAARLAGKSLLKNYGKLKSSDIRKKSKHDLVTKADMDANRIIIRAIKQKFPNHDFLSEETGFEDNPDIYQWIIDPLDGTTNYSIHNPLYCTAVTLVCKRDILLSVIYAPYLKEFYYAELGKGAFLNGKRIHVSSKRKLENSTVLLGRSHRHESHVNLSTVQKRLKPKVLNMRLLGSGSLDLAYVASGRAEACLLVPTEIYLWDSLAGILLIREAGGKVTDFRGKEWSIKSQGVFASNGLVQERLLKVAGRK